MKNLRCIVTVLLVVIMSFEAIGAENIIKPTDSDQGFESVISGCPSIVGEAAIVVDLETGYTLYEKNIYKKEYPASITKIMTATLALENLKLTDNLTFSYDAVFSIEPGSSSGYLDVDEQITVEQGLYGLMLISGNDIANGLAEAVGGTMDNFALMMTQKSKALGCVNTNFVNAHGLHDENHYTCAYDMAVMAKNIYQESEMFRTLCSTERYIVPPTNKQEETRYWRNSNRMILEGENYYYSDCIGGKTGYTNEAGGTLVTFAEINGRTLMTVILHSTNSVGAYTDSIALYDYFKENTDEKYFESLDEKYMEYKNSQMVEETEAQVIADSDQGKTSLVEEKAESSFFSTPVKIILFIVFVFIIYYFYVCYVRYQKRKIREYKRRQRRNSL